MVVLLTNRIKIEKDLQYNLKIKAKYDLTQKRKYEKSLNKQIKKEFKIIYMPGFEIIDKEEFLAVKKIFDEVAFYLPMDLKI